MSIDDIKQYFKEDHFTFLVVKANDLYFGFDLSKAEEYNIDRNCDMLPLRLDDLLNYSTLMLKFFTEYME